MTVPEILKALEFSSERFPQEAMLSAIEQGEAITPELLRVVEAVANDPAGYAARPDYKLHLFALYLLAQFREQRACAPIAKICVISEDVSEALFGDVAASGISRILASVYDGNPASLHALIEK